eukprot:scaffold34_cov260-Pinguiococcus_pyrenoidosus.AAC.17
MLDRYGAPRDDVALRFRNKTVGRFPLNSAAARGGKARPAMLECSAGTRPSRMSRRTLLLLATLSLTDGFQRPLPSRLRTTALQAVSEQKEVRSEEIDRLMRAVAREYTSFFDPLEAEFYVPDVEFIDPFNSLKGAAESPAVRCCHVPSAGLTKRVTRAGQVQEQHRHACRENPSGNVHVGI